MHETTGPAPSSLSVDGTTFSPRLGPSELSDAEIKLRGIVALAADAIVSVDDQYRITLFNNAAEQIFGYTRDEILGEPLNILIPESSRHAHHAQVESFRHSPSDSRRMGERGQIWGRRKSGELFPAEASISKIQVGGATQFTAVVRDVTAQRQAEREREELLHLHMEARKAAEAAERRIAFLAAANEILHSSLEYEHTFKALLQLIVPELARFAMIDVMEDTGRIRRLHVVHADPGKQALADRLRSYPRNQDRFLTRNTIASGRAEFTDNVTDELLAATAEDAEHLSILRALAPRSYMVVPLRVRERVLGALLLARDETAPLYGDTDLQLATALADRAASALDNARHYEMAQRAIRARDDVLGVVSHDLRMPLSVISMHAASVLADVRCDADRTHEAMQMVQHSVQWAQRLIQDLLDMSAVDAGGLSLTRRIEDPVWLVGRATFLNEPLAREHAIVLRTEVPEQMPPVEADADRITQALGNLIGNAIKFTPSGGTVVVGAATEPDAIRFFVSDSGPGVPDDDIPHIFDRFWTRPRTARGKGTGMGLAIVRGIAEAHGGRAWVTPNPAGGAVFHLALPTGRSHATATA